MSQLHKLIGAKKYCIFGIFKMADSGHLGLSGPGSLLNEKGPFDLICNAKISVK